MTFEAMIDAMSPEEKSAAMQMLWEKLVEIPEAIEPPQWHGDLVEARTAKFQRGEAQLVECSSAVAI